MGPYVRVVFGFHESLNACKLCAKLVTPSNMSSGTKNTLDVQGAQDRDKAESNDMETPFLVPSGLLCLTRLQMHLCLHRVFDTLPQQFVYFTPSMHPRSFSWRVRDGKSK